MNDQEARKAVAEGWIQKADTAIAAARGDYAAGDMALAVNRIYYACFYGIDRFIAMR